MSGNEFAPIPRQRRKPTDPAKRSAYLKSIGQKGGKRGKGKAKRRGDETYYKALSQLAARGRAAARARREQEAEPSS